MIEQYCEAVDHQWVSALSPSGLPTEWSLTGIITVCAFSSCRGDTTDQTLWSLWFDKVQGHGDSKSQEVTARHKQENVEKINKDVETLLEIRIEVKEVTMINGG